MKFTRMILGAMSGMAAAGLLASCVSYNDSDASYNDTAGDQAQPASPAAQITQADTPFYVRASMQDHINPAILAIWDISNEALDDNGLFDAALVSDAGWAQIATAAGALESELQKMADGEIYAAAAADNMVTGEYEITMDKVQGLLDANPALFRAMAAGFAVHAKKLGEAAMAKDAKLTGDLIADTDAACASCHAQFWYGAAE